MSKKNMSVYQRVPAGYKLEFASRRPSAPALLPPLSGWTCQHFISALRVAGNTPTQKSLEDQQKLVHVSIGPYKLFIMYPPAIEAT